MCRGDGLRLERVVPMREEADAHGYEYHDGLSDEWSQVEDLHEERKQEQPESHRAAVNHVEPQVLTQIVPFGLEDEELVVDVGNGYGDDVTYHCSQDVVKPGLEDDGKDAVSNHRVAGPGYQVPHDLAARQTALSSQN